MAGILYGIGVGPGEAELMTLKALRCIRESDVVILPAASAEECHAYRIVRQVFPQIAEKFILCRAFPMIKDKVLLQEFHDGLAEEVRAMLEEGKKIAFLTIGDPAVYATYSYVHSRIAEQGLQAEMVSGVPSFCAAAAALGISLGDNKEQIHIIPASYQTEELEHTLELPGTKVYMKAGSKFAGLKKILKKNKDRIEVYAVSNCGMDNEILCRGPEAMTDDSGYLTIVIVKDKFSEDGENSAVKRSS